MSGWLPEDIANQALDAAGVDMSIGSLQEGTRPAQVLLRAYGQCLRQLLRAAHWNFARTQTPLTLLADASGQTPNVGNQVPTPWSYEYAYPLNCMKVRFVPWNPQSLTPGVPSKNISIPSTPLMTGLGQQPSCNMRLQPARFLEAMDTNYLPPGNDPLPQNQGVSPQGRTVILTNVQNALVVYTALMNYPSNWDPIFRAAFVAYLASEIALPLAKDKKFGLTLRDQQIKIAQQKITQARLTDGNEGWFNNDIATDWMRDRNTGGGFGWGFGGWGGYGGGPGVWFNGWDQCNFGNSSSY